MVSHLLHHSKGVSSRHNGRLVDGVGSVCVDGNKRMPALMVRRPLQGLCRPHH